MVAACGYGFVGACWGVGLVVVIGSPAGDGVVGGDGATVIAARVYGFVGAGGGLGGWGWCEAEGSGEEGGHLGSGDGAVRAIAQWFAAAAGGDPSSGEAINVLGMHAACGVREACRVGFV